jgi:7-carboxy-7-deazaguanine synthase
VTSLPFPVVPATSSTIEPIVILAEAFVSVQGEGPLLGQRAAFVRFSRCNLHCGWCDSRYTWDWKNFDPRRESRRGRVREIAAWVANQHVDLVIVTGGEPLLQQPALAELSRLCAPARVQVETNGTITPEPDVANAVELFVVSPKLGHSGVAFDKRIVPTALAALAASGRAQWKFVAIGVTDLDEIAGLAEDFGLAPVWVMPQGTTPAAILDGQRTLADAVLARGWNLTTRLHILLWGDERGR